MRKMEKYEGSKGMVVKGKGGRRMRGEERRGRNEKIRGGKN